jgi:hypothetical protein
MSDQERFWPSATSRLLRVCPNQEEKVADQPYAGHRLGGAPRRNRTGDPILVGAHYRLWLLGLAIGIILGLYFYLRRERYREPGPDADETRFPP